MMRSIGAIIAGMSLVGCSLTPAQVAKGQLFCARATADGPLVEALTDAVGVPVIVTGLAADVVAAACASVGGVPVSPPAAPAQAPVVAAPVTVTPPTQAAPGGGVTAAAPAT